MTEKEMNEIRGKTKYFIKQIHNPTKPLCVVLNEANENGKVVKHCAYDVDYLAVCSDGEIRPVVLTDGSYRVFDREDKDFSGFYTDRALERMRKCCKHPFNFFG